MKRYISYILLQLSLPLLVITLTMTAIIWLARSIRFIDLIVNQGLEVSKFLYLSLLVVPSLLMVILPVALFCAIVMVYNRLSMDSEILVLKSAGVSRVGLAIPALILAGVVAIANYGISLYVMPMAYREFKDQQSFVRDNYASLLLQEGVFSTPVTGLTVYIDERQSDGLLKGIMVHDNRNKKEPITLMAKEGRFIQTPEGPRLDLVDGNRQEIGKDSKGLSMLYFDRYAMDISVYAKQEAARLREPEERFLHELFYSGEEDSFLRGKLLSEAHHRLVWPFHTITLALIALAGLLSGQFNRRGQWQRILGAGLAALALIVFDLMEKSLVASHPGWFIILYLNAAIFSGVGYYMLLVNRMSLSRFFDAVFKPAEVVMRWVVGQKARFLDARKGG